MNQITKSHEKQKTQISFLAEKLVQVQKRRLTARGGDALLTTQSTGSSALLHQQHPRQFTPDMERSPLIHLKCAPTSAPSMGAAGG